MRRTLSVCLSVRHVIVATGPAVVAKQQRLCRPQRGTEGRISYGHLGHTDSCLSRCEADALFVRGEQVVCHGLRVDFDTVLMFFKKGLPFQIHSIVPISIARWRHNLRQIAEVMLVLGIVSKPFNNPTDKRHRGKKKTKQKKTKQKNTAYITHNDYWPKTGHFVYSVYFGP